MIGVPAFFFLYHTPTCDDGVQNQNEKGIDCGGVCSRLCRSDIADPIVLWQRAFQVQPGFYSVVAYIQNPNTITEVHDISYKFQLRDDKNAVIAERTGHTFIPANQTFAIFESSLRTGGKIADRTTFEFTAQPVWTQLPEGQKAPNVSVSQTDFYQSATATPQLTAVVTNNDTSAINRVEVVTILSDALGTAIGASRTYIDNLSAGGSYPITFTWPHQFTVPVVGKEMIVRVYPPSALQ